MAANLTITDRINLARKYHADGAIIQGKWRMNAASGRELVCALAAFGPDINASGDCPADLMPLWLAALVPAIDDGIAPHRVAWFSGELIERAARWHVLDAAAWSRINTGFLVATVEQAMAHATKAHQGQPAPDYWPKVTAACEQVCAALKSGRGLAEAAAAAEAAEAAARAAEAAARAAAWAARAAAAR
uniref:hypothetical protein n=1 Tax=Novosphingobium sp. TaxID=1874826 RepID=UPI002620A265